MMEKLANREEFAKWLYNQGCRVGAEIGVERGKYTKVLLDAGLEVYAIDAWTAYKGYRDHVSQDKLDRFYEETKENLKHDNVHIQRGFSMDMINNFKDGSLDFVYIDANHEFKNFTNDLAEWSKKVKTGGVVAGHDYRRFGGKYGLNANHVKYVVDAWAKAHRLEIFTTKERTPSWWYIK